MSIVINGMDMPKGNSTKNLLIYSDGRVFTGHKDDVNYFAEELPSAQPEIIRCGECKYMMADGRCYEFADDNIRPSASDFCSSGVRK